MRRNLTALAFALALAISGMALAPNDTVKVEGGLISGVTVEGIRSFIFAMSGDPNGKGLPKWSSYNAETEPYLDFGDAVQLRNHLLKDQLDFLERFQKRRLPPE